MKIIIVFQLFTEINEAAPYSLLLISLRYFETEMGFYYWAVYLVFKNVVVTV